MTKVLREKLDRMKEELTEISKGNDIPENWGSVRIGHLREEVIILANSLIMINAILVDLLDDR